MRWPKMVMVSGAACAAFGLFVSVALALGATRWGSADFTPVAWPSVPLRGITMSPLPPGAEPFAMAQHRWESDYIAVLALRTRKRQTTTEYGHGLRCESGWPFRAWVTVRDGGPIYNTKPDYKAWFWGEGSAPRATLGDVTICRPLWPGLAGDVGVFGCAPLLLFGAVAGVKRWFVHRRIRQQRCPACGYDLSGLAPDAACPECGEPLRSPP